MNFDDQLETIRVTWVIDCHCDPHIEWCDRCDRRRALYAYDDAVQDLAEAQEKVARAIAHIRKLATVQASEDKK